MFVLALTPGPGVFISISAGLQEKPKQIAAMISGIITGDIIFLMLSIFGLSWVATHLQGAFLFLQYAGSAYLCYLGFVMLKNRNNTSLAMDEDSQQERGKLGYLVGLVVTLANPKVIFFYISFLPNFMDLQSLTALDIAIVIFIISIVLAISMGFYAWLAFNARHAAMSETAQRALNTASGILILVTGVIFALKTA